MIKTIFELTLGARVGVTWNPLLSDKFSSQWGWFYTSRFWTRIEQVLILLNNMITTVWFANKGCAAFNSRGIHLIKAIWNNLVKNYPLNFTRLFSTNIIQSNLVQWSYRAKMRVSFLYLRGYSMYFKWTLLAEAENRNTETDFKVISLDFRH